jgi:hypothetical protein
MKSTEEKLLLRRRGGGSVIERSPIFSSDAEYVLIYYHVMLICRLGILATGTLCISFILYLTKYASSPLKFVQCVSGYLYKTIMYFLIV